nr:MAG TPA: hypothetical protein [Caudoviricetes sp.]
MNFDIKDMKSWADRHDVNVGDKGYFTHSINWLKDDFELNVDTIACIRDDFGNCFVSEKSFNEGNSFPFFVPLKAVKEDKPKEKKYRPFKTMQELTEVVRGKDWEMNSITTGDELMIRSKGCEDRHRRVLITDLTLDNNCNLLFMNNETMKVWLDNYEVMSSSACDWVPFGVEIEGD